MTQKGVKKVGLIASCVFLGTIFLAIVAFIIVFIFQTVTSPTNDNVSFLAALAFNFLLFSLYYFVGSRWDKWFHRLPKE